MRVRTLRDLLSSTVSPRPAAVARVVVGIAAVLKALERAPVLDRFADPTVLRIPYVAGQPSVTELPIGVVVLVWLALATGFTIGAFTTITGSALTIFLAAVLLSDQQLYSNHLYLLTLFVGLLTLARSGAALSLDARLGMGRAAIPAWPVTLIRLQIVVVYLFAGLSKVNLAYLSGSVVAVSLRSEGPLAVPTDWRTFEVMAAAAAIAIVVELGLAIGLLLPRWRRTAFVAGLALHAGIALWFEPTVPLIIFAIISLGPYVVFLDGRPRGFTVVWDNSCTFCTGWVRWFRRLDWLAVLRFVPSSDVAELRRLGVTPSDADRALQLVAPDGRSEGFRAVVDILEVLPVSFLWAPILRIWPIARAGDAAYRTVALRRTCPVTPPVARTPRSLRTR